MKARFLQNIKVNDIENNMTIEIDDGEILSAEDKGDHYELRKLNGWGTMAPKECEGTIYEILED